MKANNLDPCKKSIENNYPPIYYVIQGRNSEEDTDCIEQYFIDIEPIRARQRAFDYLEDYVQLLQNGRQLYFREHHKIIDEEVKLKNIQNYSITVAKNNFGIDGIALYMVINNPILKDNKEDRYLIYTVNNYDTSKIEKMKEALIREGIYYRQYQLDYSGYTISKNTYFEGFCFAIDQETYNNNLVIKTPFNFLKADTQKDSKENFIDNVRNDLRTPDLKYVQFLNTTDLHTICTHIASFVNTKGGKIYFCNKEARNYSSIFPEKNHQQIKAFLRKSILTHFDKFAVDIDIDFLKINNVLVPVLKIETNKFTSCFYNNKTNNEFYYRAENGIKKESITEKIAQYLINRTISTEDILEFL